MVQHCPLQAAACKQHDDHEHVNKSNDQNYQVQQTHLSSVAARMYFPLGENFTNDTGGLSSSSNKKKHKQKQIIQQELIDFFSPPAFVQKNLLDLS